MEFSPPPSLLVVGTVPPDVGLKAESGAARPPSPSYCVLGPGVAQGWGPALGLWERIRGPSLASPRCKLLIKGIPGMTEPCVLRGRPACGMHPHAAQPSPLLGLALWCDHQTREAPGLGLRGVWGAWPCSRAPRGWVLTSVISAVAICSGPPSPPLRGPSMELFLSYAPPHPPARS